MSQTVEKVQSHCWRTTFSMFWVSDHWLFEPDFFFAISITGWSSAGVFWVNDIFIVHHITKLLSIHIGGINRLFCAQNNATQSQTLLCWIIIKNAFPANYRLCSTLCIPHLLERQCLFGYMKKKSCLKVRNCAHAGVFRVSEKITCTVVILIIVNLADKNNDSH